MSHGSENTINPWSPSSSHSMSHYRRFCVSSTESSGEDKINDKNLQEQMLTIWNKFIWNEKVFFLFFFIKEIVTSTHRRLDGFSSYLWPCEYGDSPRILKFMHLNAPNLEEGRHSFHSFCNDLIKFFQVNA